MDLLKITGVAVLYWGTAQLSRFSMLPDGDYLFWLPAGIALAALLIGGLKLWPGIAFGAAITLLTWGAPPWVAVLETAGNVLAPLSAAKLMTLSPRYQPGLKRISSMLLLAGAGGILTPAMAAGFDWLALQAAGISYTNHYLPEWLASFFNHSLGVFVVTPLSVAFFQGERDARPWTRRRQLEILTVCSLCVLSAILASFSINRDMFRLFSGMVFMWLIWTALRFSIRETAAILSAWVVFNGIVAARYLDILTDTPVFYVFFDLNCVMYAIGLTGLLIAATQAENRSHIASLQRNQVELQHLAEAGQIGLWSWDSATNQLTLSEELAKMIGYQGQVVSMTPEMFIRTHVYPDDQPLMWEKFTELSRGENVAAFEYRVLLPSREISYVLSEGWPVRDEAGKTQRMSGIGMDITERKRAEMAVVNERLRMSRDLHDSISQSLYSIRLLVQAAEDYAKMGSDSRLQGVLSRLADVSQQTLKEMRLMIFTLRPPELETKGLLEALRQRLEIVEARAGVTVEFSGTVEEPIPGEIEDCLYRVAQEALNNVSKHAHAHHVSVVIEAARGQAQLKVSDDGIGFDPQTVRPGLGLPGMREQVERLKGIFEIHSTVKLGTSIKVVLTY